MIPLHKQLNFLIKIFSVNVTESAGNLGLSQIYWTDPQQKLLFLRSISIIKEAKVFTKNQQHEMNLLNTKMIANNNGIKTMLQTIMIPNNNGIKWKINPYSYCKKVLKSFKLVKKNKWEIY